MSLKLTIFNPFPTLTRYPALHPYLHLHLIANIGTDGGSTSVSTTALAAGGASVAAATPVAEEKKEHVDAPGRGRASAAVLWQLFRHGGVAAAAARRWLSVLKPSWEEDEAQAWALVGTPGPSL